LKHGRSPRVAAKAQKQLHQNSANCPPRIYQKSTQRKVYMVPIFTKLEIASVLLGKVVRPGGFELPTFWFVGKQSKILSAASGVAYRGTRHLSRP
jgi:hypothetical protein